ncbi:Molecular chaperone Tir [Candidatus Desulfarcum epimagneticum]|uniref:Molecular chaperone Tir n=1 Tax=uncultured Desulfobacteraceae bacterium TaxID=218296 RepID=A0A484HIE8_9BACT|nr:Molecular chaperone Tir [uncultured Desulfobacteraceae bacterium]
MKTYNLFISHSWAYGSNYDRLIELIDNRTYFDFKDYSVPKNDPIHNAPTDKALREAIQRQMSPCQVIIILAGVYATYSKWIKKEIDLAKSGFVSPKSVLAIQPWGAEKTSTVVKDNADLIVGWNTESIIKGIRQIG